MSSLSFKATEVKFADSISRFLTLSSNAEYSAEVHRVFVASMRFLTSTLLFDMPESIQRLTLSSKVFRFVSLAKTFKSTYEILLNCILSSSKSGLKSNKPLSNTSNEFN
ncbi:hypothetical protein ACKWTF_014521 [Chironomus riparius]